LGELVNSRFGEGVLTLPWANSKFGEGLLTLPWP
jgi:hypothetical protein